MPTISKTAKSPKKQTPPDKHAASVKKPFKLEFEIRSSPRILYNFISSSSGLTEWFADDVNYRNGIFIFTWEGNEVHEAKLIATKENQSARFQWLDDPDYYFEFEIVRDDITSDVALIVTDFATDQEKEEAILLWNSEIQKLKHAIGS